MIIFHPNLSRLAMQPSYRSPLSDDTKKSVKKSRGRTCYAPPCSTLFNFFRVEPNVLESQKFFYEIIFDPSESDEPIFEKFGGLFFLRCSFWLKSPNIVTLTKSKSTKSKETYSLQKNRSICFWWNKKLQERVSFIPPFFQNWSQEISFYYHFNKIFSSVVYRLTDKGLSVLLAIYGFFVRKFVRSSVAS